jgi:preprotein translocase subunit SecG
VETLVLTIHILACIFLVVVVLLQSGQEGMGAIFGGGSQTMFGASGAGGLLGKVTAGLAAVFLLTSLTYNLLTKEPTGSIMEGHAVEQTAPAPVQPAAPVPAPAQDGKSE